MKYKGFNPKVSIIIPVYNGSNYMREAIDSALAQTYKNLEVIVVNDGSNDGGRSEEIAKSYGDKIRYFNKNNGGVSTALNLGIKKMEGEYFSWLSHDDIYNPNKIKTQIRFMKKIDQYNVVLYSDFKTYNENLKTTKEIKSQQYEQSKIRFRLITRAIINACTLLIPRICFEKIGLFDEKKKITQDADMIFRLSEKFDFYYIPETLLTIRKHPEQPRHSYNNFNKAQSDFYISCLRKISVNDLLEMSGEESIALVYAKLAWNFRKKRYYDAFSYTKELSIQYIRKNNDVEAEQILNRLNYLENNRKKDNAFKKNSNKCLKLGRKNVKTKFNRNRALKFFVLSIFWFPLNIKAWEYFFILFLPKKIISKIFNRFKGKNDLYYTNV